MSSELDFEKLFKIPLLLMKINRTHPDVKRDRKWAIQFTLMHSFYTLVFITLMYSIIVHDTKNRNFTRACANSTIGSFYVLGSFKYFMMVWHQDLLKNMFESIKRDYEKVRHTPEELPVLLEYAYRGRWLTYFWLVLAVVSAAVFPLKSIITMIYYELKGDFRLVPIFDATYPGPLENIKNNILPFTLVYLIVLWYTFYTMSIYISLVPLGPILMLHACGQLELVKMKVECFYPIQGYNHDVTLKNMKICAVHLQDIHSFIGKIQSTFQYIYELYMKGTTFVMPLACYQIVQSFSKGEISVEFYTIAAGSVLLPGAPCFYSDLLLTAGKSLEQAVYTSGWERQWQRRERTLTFMLLLRLKTSMAVRSVFRTLCLDAQ